jgi:hypothetical protein
LILTLGSPLEKGEEKKKNPSINPGQVRRLHNEPAGKGQKTKKKKKTLVLTLGSPSEKGGKKKKKTLVLTLGRSPDLDFRTFRTWTSISRPGPVHPSKSCSFVEVLKPRLTPGRTDKRIDTMFALIYKMLSQNYFPEPNWHAAATTVTWHRDPNWHHSIFK